MFDVTQLEQAIKTARPGTKLRLVIEIEVPEDPTTPPPAGGEEADEGGSPVFDLDLARATPLEKVRAFIAEHGDQSLKRIDWIDYACEHNGFSGRELERAQEAGAIPASELDETRAAGAWVIQASDLVAYLELREAVREGLRAAPAWWETVVKGRQRRAA